jgi:iron complex outermembrane receptor protein
MFQNNFAFGANVGYMFAKNGNLYANVNRSLRLPTFTDLYYKSATQIANPNLKPEESLTAELGMRWANYGFRTNLSTYYRIGQNLIDWVKRADEEKWQSVNHTRVDAMGGEVNVGYSHGYWLKNIEISYAYCHLNKEAGELLSKYALDYLEHKLALHLEHGIYKGFGASWQATYQSRNGAYSDKQGNTQTYQPFWLLDGRIFWQTDKLHVFVESSNLLNTHYYDYGGIEQPGRWVKAGISLNLDLK